MLSDTWTKKICKGLPLLGKLFTYLIPILIALFIQLIPPQNILQAYHFPRVITKDKKQKLGIISGDGILLFSCQT